MATDWFRQTHWGVAEQTLFRDKLARARPENRAQYLYLQGVTLVPVNPSAALALLDAYLDAYPNDLNVAPAQEARANAMLALFDEGGAMRAYEAAFAQMRRFPDVKTLAAVGYAEAVTERKLADRYDDALAVMREFQPAVILPVDRFRMSAARALIAEAQGRQEEAMSQARLAMEAAVIQHSGLAKHPKLGLVGDERAALVKRMQTVESRRRRPWWKFWR